MSLRCVAAINTFFILYMLGGIIVLLASVPPRCGEYVLNWL